PPRKTGIAGACALMGVSFSSRWSAASTTCPSVCPRSRARRFAALSSSSEMVTVVRMMRIIVHHMHHLTAYDDPVSGAWPPPIAEPELIERLALDDAGFRAWILAFIGR